ncbi:MAG: hypothetical protein H6607_02315 [Flavobacteriales bacterium]|nr:hypothetical protein [Flavobacteriales bacterium]
MNRLIILIIACWPISTWAQLKITHTTFEGKTYNIYPVRVPFNSGNHEYYGDRYYSRNGYSRHSRKSKTKISGIWEGYSDDELFLPYNPFKLPDGDYLIYYAKDKYKFDEWGNPVYSHIDTTIVAVLFSIKENKKNGKAVWYDYGKGHNIVQTGEYADNIKTGDWKILRKNKEYHYTYKDGEFNGEHKTYYEGRLSHTANYVLGVKNGKEQNFKSKYKNGISGEWIYDMGRLIEEKKYDKKGQITYWYNRNFGDGTYEKGYSNGKLTYQKFWFDSTGMGRTISYFENGNVKREYTSFKYFYLSEYKATKKWTIPYWYNSMLYVENINIVPDNTVSFKKYHKNGLVELEFDLTKDTFTKPIYLYNDKGIVLEKFERNEIEKYYNVTRFDPKSGKKMEFRTYYYTSSSPTENKYWTKKTGMKRFDNYNGSNASQRIVYGKKEEIVFEEYSNYFLSKKYRDSTGFVVCKIEPQKKYTDTTFCLLHTDEYYRAVKDKKRNTTKYTEWQRIDSNGKDYLQLRHFWQDKNQDFKVTSIDYVEIPKLMDEHGEESRYAARIYSKIGTKEILGKSDLINTPKQLDYSVIYQNHLYTGEINSKTSKKQAYEVKLKTIKHKDGSIDSMLFVKEPRQYSGNSSHYNWRKKSSLYVESGNVTSIQQNWGTTIHYKNNKIDGTYSSAYDFPYNANYIEGVRHGLYGNSSSFLKEYYYDKLHGYCIGFDYYSPEKYYPNQIEYKAYYHLDTLHGPFQSFVRPQELSQTVTFEKGYPHGRYWRGNVTAPTSVEVNLHHGFFVDTGYYYFKEGGLKVKVYNSLEDSVFYLKNSSYSSHNYSENDYTYELSYSENVRIMDHGYSHEDNTSTFSYWGRDSMDNFIKYPRIIGNASLSRSNIIAFNGTRTGDYTYYYKNGVVASVGRVEKGAKVGLWVYNNLNGQKYKTVNYDTGWYINPITNDTTKYYGTIEMWNPNGNKLLSGLVLSSFERFKCDQEMKVDFENIYYTAYYDKNGNQTLDYSGGTITEYHNNGEKRLEGTFANGKRNGMWKFYDPNGHLEEMGKYENGERTGIWISGDLEAVPYYENICLPGEVGAFKTDDIYKTGIITDSFRIEETTYKDNGNPYGRRYIIFLPLY